MKKLMILMLTTLGVAGNAFAALRHEIPSALTTAMDNHPGKIVFYHTGSEPMTLEGKERIAETALTIKGPGLLFNSTETINVPGSGKKQIATFSLKKKGSLLTFNYTSTKTKTQLNTDKQNLWNLKLGSVVTTPMTMEFNTASLETTLKGRSGEFDLSTLGFAYFRSAPTASTKTNSLILYDANGTWITTLDLEKGTPVNP